MGKEPFSEETFRYKYLLQMELWKVLGFAKATVEVMLSGRETEDIQANRYIIGVYCISFLIPGNWCFLADLSKKGGRKNE